MEERERERRSRLSKIFIGVAALVFVLFGLILYVFAPQLGIDPETSRLMAFVFIGAGCIDYLVLRFWDRLVRIMDK